MWSELKFCLVTLYCFYKLCFKNRGGGGGGEVWFYMFPTHFSLKTKESCMSVFWNSAQEKKIWHGFEISFLNIFREEILILTLLWNSRCSWTLDNFATWFRENKLIKELWINRAVHVCHRESHCWGTSLTAVEELFFFLISFFKFKCVKALLLVFYSCTNVLTTVLKCERLRV